jgi:hypothetical protein
MSGLIDRRVFERFTENFTGWYALKGSAEIIAEFSGEDFSAGGIRVKADKKIPESRALDLCLVSPNAASPVKEAAQVVWQRESRPGGWEAGLEFYRPDLFHLHPFVDAEEYKHDE